MSETQDVIEVMASSVWIETEIPKDRCQQIADVILTDLHAAGYRLAGPGECVVPVLYDSDAVDASVWSYWSGRKSNHGEESLVGLINTYIENAARNISNGRGELDPPATKST